MSSSYPITKCVRWRMKDWVSCFNACRLPIVDEENERNMEISPPFPGTTNGHEYSNGNRGRREDIDDFACKERIKVSSSVEKGVTRNSSIQSQMPEEEYIVFCFRENGDIHVIEDRKSTGSSHQIHTNSGNPKVMYGENLGVDPVSINIEVVSRYKEDKNREISEDDIRISTEKAKEEVKHSLGTADKRLPHEIKERANNHFVEENSSESKEEEETLLESSSASNLSSEESTTSFSFPVLLGSRRSWEWMGSPALIPHPEDTAPQSSNSRNDRCRLHFCSF